MSPHDAVYGQLIRRGGKLAAYSGQARIRMQVAAGMKADRISPDTNADFKSGEPLAALRQCRGCRGGESEPHECVDSSQHAFAPCPSPGRRGKAKNTQWHSQPAVGCCEPLPAQYKKRRRLKAAFFGRIAGAIRFPRIGVD